MEDNPYIAQSLEFDKHLLALPIKESGEGFASLAELAQKRGVTVVFDNAFDNNEEKLFYVRQSVANDVINAAATLESQGYILKFEYAYRKLTQQKASFKRRYNETKQAHPELSTEELLLAANTYTAGIPKLAAHAAGAAVDVILLDPDLNPLDMGCEYSHGGPESTTDYPELNAQVIKLRKILCEAMEVQGLVNYPFEYWHFSKGDVCAAYIQGLPSAIYSPVEFNLATNLLESMDPKLYNQFFDISDL